MNIDILSFIHFQLNLRDSNQASFWAIWLVSFFGLFRKSNLFPAFIWSLAWFRCLVFSPLTSGSPPSHQALCWWDSMPRKRFSPIKTAWLALSHICLSQAYLRGSMGHIHSVAGVPPSHWKLEFIWILLQLWVIWSHMRCICTKTLPQRLRVRNMLFILSPLVLL